ncbi:MAG TPA: hypothetical protein VFQ97_00280 [Gallionella sp.]|nr:hypothetical protein [Gallionella sp.]
MLSPEEKSRIVNILSERFVKHGAPHHCPMCGHPNFTLTDAYIIHTLQADIRSVMIGGTTIPTIGVICTNCGFVSQHAIGVLGLLPEKESQDGKK